MSDLFVCHTQPPQGCQSRSSHAGRARAGLVGQGDLGLIMAGVGCSVPVPTASCITLCTSQGSEV